MLESNPLDGAKPFNLQSLYLNIFIKSLPAASVTMAFLIERMC